MSEQDLEQADKRLTVIESNNLESLADMCAMIMAAYPLSEVFRHEKLVVMNLGMKNFLIQRITLQNKISALCDYSQIWQFIYSVFYDLNENYTEQLKSLFPVTPKLAFNSTDNESRYNLYDREHMKWNIYAQICRRPKVELQKLVRDTIIDQIEGRANAYRCFDDKGAYKLENATNWLKERGLFDEVLDPFKIAGVVTNSDSSSVDSSNKASSNTVSGKNAQSTANDLAASVGANGADISTDPLASALANAPLHASEGSTLEDSNQSNQFTPNANTESAVLGAGADSQSNVDAKADAKANAKAKNLDKDNPNDGLWSFIDLDPSEMFDKLRIYVDNEHSDDRAYELASKIADTFDQYLIYRPQWIMQWNTFKLTDFDDYDKDPNDPHNPINVFINEECLRYAKRKSGLVSLTRRQAYDKLATEIREFGSLEAAQDAHFKFKTGFSIDPNLGLDQEKLDEAGIQLDQSTLDLTPERKAAILAEIEEQDRLVLTSMVESVRDSFKQNIWQMKLWCLLRPSLNLPLDSTYLGTQEKGYYSDLINSLDRAQVLNNMIKVLSDPAKEVHLSCERVFIFGVSALPQIVIDFLSALAKRCQVFLMLFNPCHKFWADLNSYSADNFEDFIKHVVTAQSTSQRYRSLLKRKVVEVPDLLNGLQRKDFDRSGIRVDGHPLLLSYGRQCKDLINMLLDVDPMIESISCFSEPLEEGEFVSETVTSSVRDPYTLVRGGTLLKYIQTSIFNLENDKERYEIANNDHSLEVHSCFTIRREVECLKDSLLRLFNEHRCPYRLNWGYCLAPKLGKQCEYCSSQRKCQRVELLPRDIVVMVPAINTYAPHISAVFGGVDRKAPDYIPYVVSDQTESDSNTVASAMLRLLEINSERITSVMVIELLNEPAIARRFGINTDDIDVISTWLTENNVFWGLDQDDVQKDSEISIPGTFSEGLDRMILGSLLGETKHTPCFSEIEGTETKLLGKFWDFVQALRELRKHFDPELQQSPSEWEVLLKEKLIGRFFDSSDSTLRSLRCVDEFITNLKLVFDHLKKAPRITLKVFAAALRQGLTAVRNFTPYYGERVNFCSLVPMRAVPFKHVFILGLNDGDFPRQSIIPAFNLINNRDMFIRGDRSPSLDDRFLFLEALLSARKTLYLSYIGQSPIDRSERNPSLVLSELLYFLNDRCQLPLPQDPEERRKMELDPGKAVLDHLVIKERLNSYHADNYQISPSDKHLLKTLDEPTLNKLAKQEALALQEQAQSEEQAQANSAEANELVADANEQVEAVHKVYEADSADSSDLSAKSDTDLNDSNAVADTDSKLIVSDLWNSKIEKPYESKFVKSPLWRIPSFNRSFINMQQTVRSESPVLGEGNFSSLVGLPERQIVDLNAVVSFCRRPARSFMRSCMRVSLDMNNKTELAVDEEFELEHSQFRRELDNLIALPPGQQEEYISYNYKLGSYPYGVFKDVMQEKLMTSYNKMYQALSKLNLSSTSEILRVPSTRHYEISLIVPESAIYGQNPISPKEILTRYNASTATILEGVPEEMQSKEQGGTKAGVQGTKASQGEISVQSAQTSQSAQSTQTNQSSNTAAALNSNGAPSILDNASVTLTGVERAKPKSFGADGEPLLHLHVTLQLSANSLPIVCTSYSQIISDNSKTKRKELTPSDILCNDSSLVLTCAQEAIAQCLCVALDPEQFAVKESLQEHSTLLQPVGSPARFQDLLLIDRNGSTAKFTRFESMEEVVMILKQLILFYLQASCAPFPINRDLISKLQFEKDLSDWSVPADDVRITHDPESAYFFGNNMNISKSEFLHARASNFVYFLLNDLCPHFVPLTKDKDSKK